jgi:carboxyl-terminal processing protease
MKILYTQLRRSSQWAIVMIVFAGGYLLGNSTHSSAAQRGFSQPPDSEEDFEVFWQVYELIENDYVPPDGIPITPERLVDGAISGMVEILDDPNSAYMDSAQYPVFFDDLSGAIEGIGVVIRTNEEIGGIEIVNVLEGTPAARAGILIGDIFAVVDGEDVRDASQLELASLVRGPSGTVVNITMLRGEELIDFTLTRARIDVPNIDYKRIDDTSIGYIHLNQFTSQARNEIDAALADLNTETLDGLILDFRGNPGGLLSSAIDVASAFIEDGTILIEEFGDNREQVI